MAKNYGFNLELERSQQSETDWVFGASSQKCIALIPKERRVEYLPVGEVQMGRDDTMDCASRAPINILEAKFTWLLRNKKLTLANEKWLRRMGYVVGERVVLSDAFVAINSNTTRFGNSLKAPLEAIRKQGLIPKKLLPLGLEMSWDEYHDPKRITTTMRKLGAEFLERFGINYDRVYEADYLKLIEEDSLDVAGYAWPAQDKNGEYGRVAYDPNHAFVVYSPAFYVFDNYIVSESFLKKLTADYNFLDYGYRLFVSEKKVVHTSWLSRILAILKIW